MHTIKLLNTSKGWKFLTDTINGVRATKRDALKAAIKTIPKKKKFFFFNLPTAYTLILLHPVTADVIGVERMIA